MGATAGHARQWVQATSCRAECSREDRCKPTLGPLTRATPAFTRASGQADSMQNRSLARVQEGGGEGAEVGAPGPSAGPEERSAPGLPAGWGLLRPSARSCLGEGLTGCPEPRPARRAAARGAATTVACAWGAGAPTHPGRPPPPPPPRPLPRRSILRRGACSRGARVTTAGRAAPPPPPNVCSQGRSADPASAAATAAAATAALRGRRSDVSRLSSERARASGAGGAGGARGGRQGRGCARVDVCAERGAGREGERRRERARARAPTAPSLAGPPAQQGSRHLPPPAPLASRRLGAAARMRSPRGRP